MDGSSDHLVVLSVVSNFDVRVEDLHSSEATN